MAAKKNTQTGQLEDIQKMLNGKMKQLNPMLEQVKKMTANLPNMTPVEVKPVAIASREQAFKAKASMMAGGLVTLEFKTKEEALSFFNDLKRWES